MNNTKTLVIVLPIIFVSMAIHELMHAFTSDKLGDDTARLQGRISLNPLVHIDPIFTLALPILLILSHSPFVFGAAKPVQVNFLRLKYGELGGAIVGMVGPITNLVIALIAAIWFKNFNIAPGSLLYEILGFTIFVNIGFFVFNSIPWPPLDGSRLLHAVAPRPLQEFMESIERAGIAGLAIFILIFFQFLSPALGHIIGALMNHLAPGFLQFLGL